MIVSTSRYASCKTKALAKAFANVLGSQYCARGKKTVERLASLAGKKGESTLALVSPDEISFISISHFGWKWKGKALKISKYEIGEAEEEEIGAVEGKDAEIFQTLFGLDMFYAGDAVLCAEKGKMEVVDEEGKRVLEIEYEIIEDGTGNEGSRAGNEMDKEK